MHASMEAQGKTIAIDGKTICGSGNNDHSAYHVVSAWVTENQITLGQLVTEEKSNEITAVPVLLDHLNITGSTVTIDAMGCQRNIASKISEKGADYVLALKANQETLYNDMVLYFMTETAQQACSTLEKDHGRIERREYYLETDIDWFSQQSDWVKMNGIGMVKTIVTNIKTNKQSEECRCFITSLTDVEEFARAVRNHWSIESQLHWHLDVSFREDTCRARKDNSPLNLNLMRKEALSLLNNADFSKRVSIRRKMSRAAMDNSVLEAVVFGK